MSHVCYIFLLILLLRSHSNSNIWACNTDSSHNDSNDSSQELDSTKIVDRDEMIDFSEIMQICNESFRITMDFLEEFNNTGSFPDESDKTPMCYLRCYLEKAGILKDSMIVDKVKATKYIWPLTGNSFEACQDEAKYEKNPCVKAYFIARCLMIRTIVDSPPKDINT